MPHALYYTGIPLGFVLILLLAIQTTVTVPLYLRATEYLPGKPESFFEIGYLLFERRSIFGICFIIWFNSFGLMMIYFILFSQTMKQLVRDFGVDHDSVFAQQWFYAALLGVLLIPVILQKKLEELKIVAFSLFGLVLIFCVMITVQLFAEDSFNPDSKSKYHEYYVPKAEIDSFSAISVILVAFSCQQNLFPIYSELLEKNERSHTIVFGSACMIVGVLYTAVSIVALYMFGSENCEHLHTILDMISKL